MRRHSYAGAFVSLRTGCMAGLVKRRSIDAQGGWQTSITPQPETTSGTLPLGRFIQPSAVVHLIISLRSSHLVGDHLFDLGPPLLPPRAVYARNVFSSHVRILGPLLGLTEIENTGGATSNTCCLNARVSWAWEARCQLSFSGMTSLGHVLDLIMHRRCWLQHTF